MPKYMFQATYTGQGLDGLLKEGGTSRQAAVEKAIRALGGTPEVFYFAFGEFDVFGIADMSDNVSASAFSLAVTGAGGANVRTTVLITPEEVDQAVKKTTAYRAPGQ